MTEQRDRSASEAVDRLIESRRTGETDVSSPELPGDARDLATLAATLEDEWRQQPAVDEDAIWQRVNVGMHATPQSRPRRWVPLSSALASFTLPGSMIRPTPTVVTAALAVVLVILATFATQRQSANATFVADVENLASFTAAVLNDRQLSPRERGEVERRASGLLSVVQANPSVLAQLDGGDAELVVSRIDGILTLLEPYEDDQHGGVETSVVPLASVREQVESARGVPPPPGAFTADTATPSPIRAPAAAATEASTPDQRDEDQDEDDEDGPRRDRNVPSTPRASATPGAGLAPAATPPLDSGALRELCGNERDARQGRCRAAMEELEGACDGGDRSEERCEEAIEDALEACRDLRDDEAAAGCERALLALIEAFASDDAERDNREDNGRNGADGDEGENEGGPGDDDGDRSGDGGDRGSDADRDEGDGDSGYEGSDDGDDGDDDDDHADEGRWFGRGQGGGDDR